MSGYYGISGGRGGPFARMNWDSPASVHSLTATRPARRRTVVKVLLLPCGCESWINHAQGEDPDGIRIPQDPRWAGARWVDVVHADGWQMLVDGKPLTKWTACPHGWAD